MYLKKTLPASVCVAFGSCPRVPAWARTRLPFGVAPRKAGAAGGRAGPGLAGASGRARPSAFGTPPGTERGSAPPARAAASEGHPRPPLGLGPGPALPAARMGLAEPLLPGLLPGPVTTPGLRLLHILLTKSFYLEGLRGLHESSPSRNGGSTSLPTAAPRSSTAPALTYFRGWDLPAAGAVPEGAEGPLVRVLLPTGASRHQPSRKGPWG